MKELIERRAAIETLKKLLYESAFANSYNPLISDVYAEMAENRIETWVNLIPPAQQWVPIDKNCLDKRELPDNFFDVLISIKDDVFIAYRTGAHWHISGGGKEFIDFADAWMPKPKPYEEVE